MVLVKKLYASMFAVFCCHANAALCLDEQTAGRLSIFDHHPESLAVYDYQERTNNPQHHFSLNLPVSPYVSIGEQDGDLPDTDIHDVHSEWRNHSYESTQREKRQRKKWAGFKLKLSKLFKMNVDPRERRVRSTLSISPKTKVKVRANLREIRADMIYRF